MDLFEQIETLFDRLGDRVCTSDEHGQPVSARAHALQCAQLAEWADAGPELVTAALLHDIGHFASAANDDDHEVQAMGLLGSGFEAGVPEPIRLHVQAKRYLVRCEPGYRQQLGPGALASLERQGGPMSDAEQRAFEAMAYGPLAVALRRWDDRACQTGRRTPPLSYYLDIAHRVRKRVLPAPRLVCIGAPDIA